MHYSRHQTSHTHQSKVLFRNIDIANMKAIANIREHESGDTAQEQTRSEDTTATSTTVSGARCEYLKQDNKYQIDNKQVAVTVKQRAVHYSIPIER